MHPFLTAFFSVCVSAQKNALHADTWRKSQQFFVCVYVSGKKTPCLLKFEYSRINDLIPSKYSLTYLFTDSCVKYD